MGRKEMNMEKELQSGSTAINSFQDEALFLANHYGDMLRTRDALKKRLEGSWEYTEDMAIDELVTITPNYSGDHVQSSGISNTTARITDKLMDGYVERRQSQMAKEREACRKEYEYVDWKVSVITTAVRERLDKKSRTIFLKNRGEGRSYREMQKRSRKGALPMQTIRNAIMEGVDAIQSHLRILAYCDDSQYLERLSREVENDRHTKEGTTT